MTITGYTTTVSNETELQDDAEIKIPSFFRKSGYQGYKIFLDRYTLKAEKGDLSVGDLVLAIVVLDPKWPVKELSIVQEVSQTNRTATVKTYQGDTHQIDFDLISKLKAVLVH